MKATAFCCYGRSFTAVVASECWANGVAICLWNPYKILTRHLSLSLLIATLRAPFATTQNPRKSQKLSYNSKFQKTHTGSPMYLNAIFVALKHYIPETSMFMVIIKNKLEAMSEERLKKALVDIYVLGLKKPSVGLVLGIFFGYFGIDRFYRGDVAMGAAKFALPILISVLIAARYELGDSGIFMAMVATLLVLFWLIWWVADLFIVRAHIIKDNAKKVLDTLEKLESRGW